MGIPLSSGTARGTSGRSARSGGDDGVLVGELRRRLTSDLHMGRVRPGDRLPSIRAVTRASGADHRAVARAYRTLEAEGLVEIQGRSGVRVAAAAATGPEAGEPAHWLATVLAESWGRRVSTHDLLRMLQAGAGGAGLRCACVESDRDQMVAYCEELGQLSGMTMVPCYVSARAGGPGERERLREALRAADVVVTTQFHASPVRAALGPAGPPLVVLRVDPELAEAVSRRLRARPLTVVASSPGFGERLRQMYAEALAGEDRLRVVLANDEVAVRALDPAEPILLTRAARKLLPDLPVPPLLFPHSPTIARASVEELTRAVVEVAMR